MLEADYGANISFEGSRLLYRKKAEAEKGTEEKNVRNRNI